MEEDLESLEVSARTVNEAIEKAMRLLGKAREELVVSVLTEGSRGILGIGGEDARILVTPRDDSDLPIPSPSQPDVEVPKIACSILEDLLAGMGVHADVQIRDLEAGASQDGFAAALDISNHDLSMLIGRRGETLSALQFITTLILSKRLHHWTKVLVDVEGYRIRREQTLRGLAQRMAARVQESGQQVTLEAMPPNERRIVHLALQNHPAVTTVSYGEGDQRRVVISRKR